MQAIILAAGKGKRLAPVTDIRSKPGLPAGGKPIIQRVIEQIYEAGIDEFIVVIHPNDTALMSILRSEIPSQIQLKITTQDHPKGMADALQCAVPLIEGAFLLSAADNLTSTMHIRSLIDLFQASSSTAGVLSIMQISKDKVTSTGIVELAGTRITRIIEKPALDEAPSNISSLPLYILSPIILEYLYEMKVSRRGEYELQDIIQAMIDSGLEVNGLMTSHRLSLTTIDDLLRLNLYFMGQEGYRSTNRAAYHGKNTRLIKPYCIGPGVVLGDGCTIGPGVLIEKDCMISSGVTTRNAVILEGSHLEESSRIENAVVYPQDRVDSSNRMR